MHDSPKDEDGKTALRAKFEGEARRDDPSGLYDEGLSAEVGYLYGGL
jgi:hypothetical protein